MSYLIEAYQQKKFGEAAYFLRIASDLTGDPQWLCQLGDAYIQLDSLPSADSAYGRAITTNPELACAYFGMAELYYRRSDYNQAATYCREGLRREPSSQTGQALLKKIQSKQ